MREAFGRGEANLRPAVVNLLVNSGTLGPEAVAATVVDLAARGHLHVEQVSAVHCYRRTVTEPPEDLAPYERRVLGLFRADATDSLVPFSEVAVGVEDEVDAWWEQLDDEVVADARERGLITRWSEVAAFFVAGVLGITTMLAFVRAATRPDDQGASRLAVAVFVITGLTVFWSDGVARRVRLSRLGRELRHQCLAVADWGDGFRFTRLGGVTIWGETLARATALGLAPQVVADVPVRPEGARVLWLRREGEWTRVRVRYPSRLPLGQGRPPLIVAAMGAAGIGLAAAILLAARRPGSWHPSPPFAEALAEALGRVEAVIAGIAALGLLAAMWTTALAAVDLIRPRRAVAGDLVARRVDVTGLGPWTDLVPRRRSIAIDDGRGRTIRAYRVRREVFARARVGDHVRATATPALRHLRELGS